MGQPSLNAVRVVYRPRSDYANIGPRVGVELEDGRFVVFQVENLKPDANMVELARDAVVVSSSRYTLEDLKEPAPNETKPR